MQYRFSFNSLRCYSHCYIPLFAVDFLTGFVSYNDLYNATPQHIRIEWNEERALYKNNKGHKL